MALPVLSYASFGSGFLPFVAAARPARLSRPLAWILIWCALSQLENLIALPLALSNHNNLFLNYIFAPLRFSAVLWALSLWQIRPFARLVMRAIIPPFLVAWLALLLIENLNSFSAVGEPIGALLGLGAAMHTLAARSAETTDSLPRQDWFWICAALALYCGPLTLLSPLGAALIGSNPEVVRQAFTVWHVITIVTFLVISIGVLCRLPSARSGLSLSPASSA